MTKSIFILEDITACRRFLDEIQWDGISEKKILGIGTFFTQSNKKTEKGLFVHVTPTFLTNELRQGIVNGYISAFEQDSIFFQTPSPNSLIPISNWLLYGHHLDSFSPSQMEVQNQIPDLDLQQISSPEDFVSHFLKKRFQKIDEIKINIAIYLLDLNPLSHYIISLIQKSNTTHHTHNEKWTDSDLEEWIAHAVFNFLSRTQSSITFALVPSHQKHYEMFLRVASQVQRDPHTNVTFKL